MARGARVSRPSVYVETTVVSYLVAKPSRDLIVAAHRQMTRQWWEGPARQFELLISPVVLDEIAVGDPDAARERLAVVSGLRVLQMVPEVEALGAVYFARLGMPRRARPDAFHLAFAAWHGVEFRATWNCTHLANACILDVLGEVNAARGIRTPIVCTPEQLIWRPV